MCACAYSGKRWGRLRLNIRENNKQEKNTRGAPRGGAVTTGGLPSPELRPWECVAGRGWLRKGSASGKVFPLMQYQQNGSQEVSPKGTSLEKQRTKRARLDEGDCNPSIQTAEAEDQE